MCNLSNLFIAVAATVAKYVCVCGENGCILPNVPFLVEAESSEAQVLKKSRMLTSFDKEELTP